MAVKINELKKSKFFILRYQILDYKVLDFIMYFSIMTGFVIKAGIMISGYLDIYY